MSSSRRDVLKLAAGLGLTGATPTIAERIAAAERLRVSDTAKTMANSPFFAEAAMRHISMDEDLSNTWFAAVCPKESAAHKQASRHLDTFAPNFGTYGDELSNAIVQHDEAAFDLALAMYDAGVRHGAAFEHLRRSVVGDVARCTSCWGVGIRRSGEECSDCGSIGLVMIAGGGD